mmetsp:Transcript_73415/g.192514  ORF Transcript_73415/g.192514 Transcript_73415/m.192514 type:complete len:308 (+) Transcript_73415:61-984(+)
MRTRLFDRLCPGRRRPGSSPKSTIGLKFPETPLILAGALGGPLVIFFLTPLRNALSIAAQDSQSSASEIYGHVFENGLSAGWTGGMVAVPASCPQFCVMGPFFHLVSQASGSAVIATVVSAVAETVISFSSQTLNCQMALMELRGGLSVPLQNRMIPLGPGATVHVIRNIVALSGIRIFSGPCQAGLEKVFRALGLGVPVGVRQLLGDFTASLGSAVLSAPLNQMHGFAVCSAAYVNGGLWERVDVLTTFLSTSYLNHDAAGRVVGFTSTLPRDLFLRCAYVATLFALFGSIERLAVLLWGRRSASR